MTKLSVRPLQEKDIAHIANYITGLNEDDALRMGVDKNKCSSKEELMQSLLEIYHTPLAQTKFFYMIWLVNDQAIGHSALKEIHHGEIANMHLHMWTTEHRGKGYGGKLFCLSALEFYRLFNLKLILCEPRATNPMPNNMLSKVGFRKWKTYVAASSELALPCELNSYIIDSEIATNFVDKN